MDIRLMDNDNGFEMTQDNVQVGRIVWILNGNVMVMNGTFIDPSLRGKNAGERLLDEAANFARKHAYKMEAICPYVVKMFERHDKYNDVKIS